MVQYSGLAVIYDQLMQSVDYDEWAEYIGELTHRHGGIPRQNVLDVACGTGTTTLALARAGYPVTGLDLSAEMLSFAREKAESQGTEAAFMQADMRTFSLAEPVGLVVSFQDGINYLLTAEDLTQTFSAVGKALLPEGLFIFDVNRVDKLQDTKTETSWVDCDDFTLIWETRFVEQDIWEIAVTGFTKLKDGNYQKFSEVHKERVISEEEVQRSLHHAGLELVGRYAAFSLDEPDFGTRRVFYVARKER
ncbi:class I SAM-dependent DNA methyltransferase [Dethiobacter alkaliphilus]|uniref:Methyltransferase type 11 n=1 Tax=Dethiobacter alkaliphilus AHT 1 TaxID=555088 RepID=C0GHC2_DETAL|nr:class I SAM-dependent methyltransferase [Dethiobacter alkaliphilus]EEG77128.1 Methyltransferase type 11 [Dethiobacter alkaliphilus AHT 1]